MDVLKGIYPTASVVLVKIDVSWLWKTEAARVRTPVFHCTNVTDTRDDRKPLLSLLQTFSRRHAMLSRGQVSAVFSST